MTSKDSDRSVYPPSMPKVLVYSFLDAINKDSEGTARSLIVVFASSTSLIVGFVTCWLITVYKILMYFTTLVLNIEQVL